MGDPYELTSREVKILGQNVRLEINTFGPILLITG
jgi:hypothetical protein